MLTPKLPDTSGPSMTMTDAEGMVQSIMDQHLAYLYKLGVRYGDAIEAAAIMTKASVDLYIKFH